MATKKEFLSTAAAEIGYKESPAGSNKTKFGKAYGLNGQPWCAMFVWYILKSVKASKEYFGGKKTAYTPTLAQYYKNNNQWTKTPKAGDLVFFHNRSRICHVGIVEKVISDDIIQTIEGNTGTTNQANGGMVMRRQRSTRKTANWYIAGFARLNFDPEPAKKPATTSTKKPTILTYTLKRTLKKGMSGADVKKLQAALKKKGYKISVDGKFGPQTLAAVKNFQKKNKITRDGIVGKKTASKLGWKFK